MQHVCSCKPKPNPKLHSTMFCSERYREIFLPVIRACSHALQKPQPETLRNPTPSTKPDNLVQHRLKDQRPDRARLSQLAEQSHRGRAESERRESPWQTVGSCRAPILRHRPSKSNNPRDVEALRSVCAGFGVWDCGTRD